MAPPKLRISPSGPVATDENPLADFGGNFYGHSPSSAVEYPAKIGPSDAGAVFAPSLEYVIGGYSGAIANSTALVSRGGATPVTFGPGFWAVELELGVGFATSPPSTDDAACLNITLQMKNGAGTDIGSPVTYLASPLPSTGTGTFGGDVVHSSKIPLVIEVTPEMIAANGNAPISGVEILVTRVSGASGNDYTTTSGWLEFSKDTNVHIHRIR